MAADEQEGDGDGGETDRTAGPERPLEATGECGDGAGAVAGQCVVVGGGDGGGEGDADRASDLLGGVEQAGGEAGVARADAGEASDRDGDEGEGGAGARDEEGAGEVAPNWPWTGMAVAQRMPPPIRPMPAAITYLAEMRVTSACERPARPTEVSEAASQAMPVSMAE